MYYAVANGRVNGIFETWKECSSSIFKYKGAIYKKFESLQEAEQFISLYKEISLQTNVKNEEKKSQHESIIDYYVYTDGACVNNGKVNAKAGIGIYFGKDDPRNQSKRVIGKQTNNVAELTAIIETYKLIEQDIKNGKQICIVTDSEYCIKCVQNYGKKCAQSNWTLDIPNKELVQQIYLLYNNLTNVHFFHVNSHTHKQDIHSLGNEQADLMANLSIGCNQCPSLSKDRKIYLNVSFEQKDEAKKMGAKWDPKKKKWYVFEKNALLSSVLEKFS